MTFDKRFRYWLLCEDKQLQCFFRYFLIEQGVDNHYIHPLPLPANTTGGCGSQYVIEKFPTEISRLRSQCFNSVVLLVCLDADTNTVRNCVQKLDKQCKTNYVQPRNEDDMICYFIPKRNVETWIHHLRGEEAINEEDDYGHFRKKESKCRDASRALSEMFAGDLKNTAIEPLPSISYAYEEFKRIGNLQSGRS